MKKVEFVCNLCSHENSVDEDSLGRERHGCLKCGSTGRHRETVYSFSKIRKRNARSRYEVIGLSDHAFIEKYFSELPKASYQNTYYDTEPMLDVTNPARKHHKAADLLINSDVLEHVMFPWQKALSGSFKILKPGGHLILTVPYKKNGISVEKYAHLASYEVSETGEVSGTNFNNEIVTVEDPIFHGGPGNTLEMRILSLAVILDALRECGFINIVVDDEDVSTFGIVRGDEVGVIVAQRPSFKNLFKLISH